MTHFPHEEFAKLVEREAFGRLSGIAGKHRLAELRKLKDEIEGPNEAEAATSENAENNGEAQS